MKPIRSDIAGILRRTQPRWQRYRGAYHWPRDTWGGCVGRASMRSRRSPQRRTPQTGSWSRCRRCPGDRSRPPSVPVPHSDTRCRLAEPIRIALVREGRMARTEKASTCSQSLCTSRFRVTYRVEWQSLEIELHDCCKSVEVRNRRHVPIRQSLQQRHFPG